jgi:hypothetical protein
MSSVLFASIYLVVSATRSSAVAVDLVIGPARIGSQCFFYFGVVLII